MDEERRINIGMQCKINTLLKIRKLTHEGLGSLINDLRYSIECNISLNEVIEINNNKFTEARKLNPKHIKIISPTQPTVSRWLRPIENSPYIEEYHFKYLKILLKQYEYADNRSVIFTPYTVSEFNKINELKVKLKKDKNIELYLGDCLPSEISLDSEIYTRHWEYMESVLSDKKGRWNTLYYSRYSEQTETKKKEIEQYLLNPTAYKIVSID